MIDSVVTTEWKYTQLIDYNYNNWSILVTTEWKYAQLIDHITLLIDFSHNQGAKKVRVTACQAVASMY